MSYNWPDVLQNGLNASQGEIVTAACLRENNSFQAKYLNILERLIREQEKCQWEWGERLHYTYRL